MDANVNQSRPWELDDEIKVFSIALRIENENEIEWLLYVYSPISEIEGVELTIPGYGVVRLNSSPKGEYYHLENSNDQLIRLNI